MSKPLILNFFDRSVKPSEKGLKHVLFQLWKEGKMIGFEWGFMEFDGEFDNLEQDGVTARVFKWAEMPNPKLLL